MEKKYKVEICCACGEAHAVEFQVETWFNLHKEVEVYVRFTELVKKFPRVAKQVANFTKKGGE